MFPSEAFAVIIAVVLVAAEVLVSLLVYSYAAYSFLETLENTASGNDEVIWPGDPLPDWIWRLWYLAWIVAVWAVPLYFVLGYHTLTPWQFAVALLALLWLIFPVSLLSSLSGSSRWIIFRPSVLRSLLKSAGTLGLFYVLTGILIALSSAVGFLALFGQFIFWVPLAAVCWAVALLIYARLLGRMALVISLTTSPESGQKDGEQATTSQNGESSSPAGTVPVEPAFGDEAQAKAKAEALTGQQAQKPAPPALQPSDQVGSTAADSYGPAEGTYDLLLQQAPPSTGTPPPSSAPPKHGLPTYSLAPPEARAPGCIPGPEKPERAKEEFKMAVSYDVPPPPAHPLWDGVFSFPFYKTTLGPLIVLTFGFLAVVGLFRALVFIFPGNQ
ncbi:MAG TPA: hypothetical protein VK395_37775 [Gemmataceae bacterium]|nr:hypothetical protein [Gemmataceae bacterium]